LFGFTLARLAERSAGWRESAAIWAGTLDGNDAIASDVFFHHELCDDQAGPLFLEVTEQAKFDLYRTVAAKGKKLVGMVHTHPEDWVELSPVDEQNQLCSRIGFWSLVVPWYGRPPWDYGRMGVHVRADTGWHQHLGSEIFAHVILAK
jgi:proteasome lid subunit RPN8/RPN11